LVGDLASFLIAAAGAVFMLLLGVRNRGQAWSTFVRNHLSQIWACDFFTIVSLPFQVLYGFVILALERRQIMHVGVTAHPTAEWAAQRVVETVRDGTPGTFVDRPPLTG
jgi:hypothetical protein